MEMEIEMEIEIKMEIGIEMEIKIAIDALVAHCAVGLALRATSVFAATPTTVSRAEVSYASLAQCRAHPAHRPDLSGSKLDSHPAATIACSPSVMLPGLLATDSQGTAEPFKPSAPTYPRRTCTAQPS